MRVRGEYGSLFIRNFFNVIVVQKVRSFRSIVVRKEKLGSRVETFPLCKKKKHNLPLSFGAARKKTFGYSDYLPDSIIYVYSRKNIQIFTLESLFIFASIVKYP